MGCLAWILILYALFNGGLKLAWMVFIFILVFNWIRRF